MVILTHLPAFFVFFLRTIPVAFRHRHSLYLKWLILMQIVCPGPKTLANFARFTPPHIREWHFRRLLKAGYWSYKVVLWHFADCAILSFTPPENGVLYIIVDASHKEKRGKKNKVVQKSKKNKYSSYFFGIKFVVLMVQWDNLRIPVDFEIILPKDHKKYMKENKLFQQMLKRFSPPEWAKLVIVVGDCAYASKENMKTIQKRDKNDTKRNWRFVFAIARTWNMENGKKLKDLVTYLARKFYTQTWIPKLPNENRRKVFWVFAKRTRLCHIGDVTIVLSKKGRNLGPKKTKIIVTNLTGLTARQVLSIYQRRWQIEILFKELKSGLGLGEHQITKNEDSVEKSFSIAFMAYLVLLRIQRKDIQPGKSWSIFQLKNNFTMGVIKNQIEHDFKLKMEKQKKTA